MLAGTVLVQRIRLTARPRPLACGGSIQRHVRGVVERFLVETGARKNASYDVDVTRLTRVAGAGERNLLLSPRLPSRAEKSQRLQRFQRAARKDLAVDVTDLDDGV